MNKGLTGLEQHEGEYLMTEISFLVKLTLKDDFIDLSQAWCM